MSEQSALDALEFVRDFTWRKVNCWQGFDNPTEVQANTDILQIYQLLSQIVPDTSSEQERDQRADAIGERVQAGEFDQMRAALSSSEPATYSLYCHFFHQTGICGIVEKKHDDLEIGHGFIKWETAAPATKPPWRYNIADHIQVLQDQAEIKAGRESAEECDICEATPCVTEEVCTSIRKGEPLSATEPVCDAVICWGDHASPTPADTPNTA